MFQIVFGGTEGGYFTDAAAFDTKNDTLLSMVQASGFSPPYLAPALAAVGE